jgi:hypothetical protein
MEPIPEQNTCVCLPTNSCTLLGGNATIPEFDGTGMLEARIINVS